MEYFMSTESKKDLLARAKKSIEVGDEALRDAAEALATAQETHGTSQQEMAKAVGKSQPWVSRLLQWRREDYPGDSPFGPTTKAERDYAHANKKKVSKPRDGKKGSSLKVATKNTGADPVPTNPADDPVEQAKQIIRNWFANMTDVQKAAVVAFVMEESGQRIRLAA
jgi:hypothetical protein